VGKWVIEPLQDVEVCEYRRLPNRKPMDVAGFELRMPPGAHHFALWGYGGSVQDDAAFPKGVVESVGCNGIARDDVFPQLLIPTTSPNTRYVFPPGVALPLEARQQVWLNPHMRNGTTKKIRPKIAFNLVAAKPGTVKHRVAGFTVGNMGAIDVPPGGEQTVTSEWNVPADLTVVHLTSHQHQLGIYARVDVVPAGGGPVVGVYENHDWAHPFQRDEPLALHAGEKLRVTCRWRNPNAHRVRFGPETTDEMCFAIGFYYRTDGSTAPVIGAGCLPAKRGLLCPLAPAIASSSP